MTVLPSTSRTPANPLPNLLKNMMVTIVRSDAPDLAARQLAVF